MRLCNMKLISLLVLVFSVAGAAYAGPIFEPVEPDDGYLRIEPGDSSGHGNLIRLFDLSFIPGAVPGATLLMQSVGGLCFIYGTQCMSTSLGAVFTADTTTAADPNTLQRLLTVIGPPQGIGDLASPNTYYGGLSTNFDGDFWVPNGSVSSVVIPNGANWLVPGVIDSYYMDNTTWEGHTLGIELEVANPEPGTLVLLASGFGLLGAFLRQRRTSCRTAPAGSK